MDPVGCVASFLTLLETALVVGKATTKLICNLREAPEEVQWVSSRMLQTRAQLLMILRLQNGPLSGHGRDGNLMVLPEDLVPLRVALNQATECLNEIEEAVLLTEESTVPGFRAIRWVTRDKRLVGKLTGHLRDVESSLAVLLMAISLSISSASFTSITDLASKHSTILETVLETANSEHARKVEAFGERHMEFTAECSEMLVLPQWKAVDNWNERNWARRPRIWRRSPSQENNVSEQDKLPPLSSSAIFNTRWNELYSIYSLSLLLRLPYILSKYAIVIHARVQQYRAAWPSISHSVTVKNVVPSDSRMMRACLAGDLFSVRDLVLSRQGSPTDIDEYGKPAIRQAVKSGSFELVKFLLDNGADANALEERCQESPLELACRHGLLEIGRLLLLRGACVEHIDAGGCTPLVNLWHNMNLAFSRVEFAKALSAVSRPPIHPEMGEFINPKICIAMRGCAEDIDFLAGLGAKWGGKDNRGERIIKYCIWGSNPLAYDCLVALMPQGWISEVDDRGRTPLHMALEFPGPNTEKIVERLLKAGSDIYARDHNSCLPEDVAKATDRRAVNVTVWKTGTCRNFEVYVRALRSCGYHPEVDGDGDIFWPTRGNYEL